MKKIISLIACFIILTSCSSDSSSEENSLTGSITATIDGQNWRSNIAIAAVQSVNFDEINGSVLQIMGTASNASSLAINIPLQNLSVGTYTYNGFDAEGNLSYNTMDDLYSSDETDGTFTLTISSYNISNGTISGTFSGTLIGFDTATEVSVTNGTFSNITVISQQLYSNGSMSLKLNSGSVFNMDTDNSDGKYLMIQQVSEANKIVVYGYNTNLGADYGIYSIMIPENATVGSHTIDGNNYDAGFNNNSNIDYTTTGGTINITSHSGNTIVGTFNFTATGNSQTMTISQGNFSITYN
ncbi:hypothetical protein B0I03_10731 [Flavobacterium aquaticum]|uniref:Uncharacterized protein n=1 Tax=Flavobacterium aquaticum TaxID=1236486 RepID=A0A327YJP6_9FLAO|nr:DUF6252 family protein [Flavobacterium aquaticum]RAK20612.1 hypothetical protein B0I03_10731 [Flavobacterium aquaticum]